jgi:RecB family endonuclease NucS
MRIVQGSDEPSPIRTSMSPTRVRGEAEDNSLIRWMLSLTPAERLRVLQNTIDSIQRLRHGISM